MIAAIITLTGVIGIREGIAIVTSIISMLIIATSSSINFAIRTLAAATAAGRVTSDVRLVRP